MKMISNQEVNDYFRMLNDATSTVPFDNVQRLTAALFGVWRSNNKLLICGNGGSAGNAIHLANDFIYGVGGGEIPGLDVEALTSNASVLTCLGNDVGYDRIFSEQIKAKGRRGDVLLALSGSGNSPNIVKALETGNHCGLETHAILGFSGGHCINIAGNAIHIPIEDMQIAEDLQIVIGHICMKWLFANRLKIRAVD